MKRQALVLCWSVAALALCACGSQGSATGGDSGVMATGGAAGSDASAAAGHGGGGAGGGLPVIEGLGTHAVPTADSLAVLTPGNALGTGFSGKFILDHYTEFRCLCRVSTCDPVSPFWTAWIWTLYQKDGAFDNLLMSYREYGDSCLGGTIDASGRFSCGRVRVDTPDRREIYLAEGRVITSGGVPTSLEGALTVSARATVADGGKDFDCDFYSSAIYQYAP